MKKIISAFLVFTVLLYLCSCGKKKKDIVYIPANLAYVLIEKENTHSAELAAAFQTAFQNSGGAVEMQSYGKETKSFKKILKEAKDKKPLVIYAPATENNAKKLISDAKSAGIKCPFMGDSAWKNQSVLDEAEKSGITVYLCEPFFDGASDDKTLKSFVKGYKEFISESSFYSEMNGDNETVSSYAALGYDSYNLLYSAIKKAAEDKGKNLTSSDIAAKLWHIDLNGITGKIVFDYNGDSVRNSAYIVKSDNGKYILHKNYKIKNKTEKAEGEPDYSENTGIKLDTKNKIITVGVYEPINGGDFVGAKQEICGIAYANNLKNEIKIAGDSYKIELFFCDSSSAVTPDVHSALGMGALAVLGKYSYDDAEILHSAAVPGIIVSGSNSSVTAENKLSFKASYPNSFEGEILGKFAFELLK